MKFRLSLTAVFLDLFDVFFGCDIEGAKELGVIYFPTNWGAKELQQITG